MRLKLSRKSSIILALAAIVILGLATVGVLLKHEPSYYGRASVEAGPERKLLSTACLGRFTQLVGHLQDPSSEWDIKMSQGQLNSFFMEDFIRLGVAEDFAKHGVHDVRIVLEQDRMRLGFRYGSGFWSTVVTYDLRLWLAAKDVNVVAVEILGRRAGGLPLTTQSLLREMSELAKKRNIDISWYRRDGNPVALVRFQADRPRPTFQLQRLDVANGMIHIGGKSFESIQPAALPGEKTLSLRAD